MDLRTPSDFHPGMISTPGWGLPSFRGYRYHSFQHPMTPITRPDTFTFGHELNQGLYNSLRTPIPYGGYPLRGVTPGTLTTRSVSFSIKVQTLPAQQMLILF